MHDRPLAAALLIGASAAFAPRALSQSPLSGRLESGRYLVGLSVLFDRDTTRPALPADSVRPSTAGRQMQLVVWYPAVTTAESTVTLRDYVGVSGGKLGPEGATAERRRQLAGDFATEPISHGISPGRVESVLALPMGAALDAPRASGRFPLIVFLHATPWQASVMSEYLASHGYVVAAIESKGFRDVTYRLSPENLDAMVRDAAFTVQRMRRESNVGERLGVVGMSNGSIAALALQLSGTVPAAVVSLDGGIGEGAGGTYLGDRAGGDVMRFTVPLLHLYTPDNPHLELRHIRSYEAAPRMLVQVGHLRHGDFLTIGALESLIPGAFGDAPLNATLGFEYVCRYTLAFLQRHVSGERDADRFLNARPEENGAPEGLLSVERIPSRAPTSSPRRTGRRHRGR